MTHERECKPCISCYQNFGCRCPECSNIQRIYKKRWKYDHDRGVSRLVDVQPVRDHCQRLLDAGMSVATICTEAGVPYGTVAPIIGAGKRRTQRVQRTTAKALLGVKFRPGKGTLVEGIGSARRLQDLALRGFGLREMAEATGINKDIVSRIRAGRHRHMYPRTRDAITAAYAAREGKEPDSPLRQQKALANYARKKGWAPLATYDDPDSPFDTARARRRSVA